MVVLLVGLVFGGALGFVSGIATSSNWYEYPVLSTSDDPIKMLNQDGWEPLANLKTPSQTVLFHYRRPRVRLGE